MTKEISLRPAHFQSFHKGSENAVIKSERLPGWVSFATIFLSKRRRRSLFHGSAPHEASVGRVCRKKHFVRSSPQRSRSLQARRLRNIRPTAQRWMWGLRPICGPVSQRLISPPGRIRPARQLPGAGLIVSIRLSRGRYLAAAAFLLRDRAWMPSTTSTMARTTSRMAMIARM